MKMRIETEGCYMSFLAVLRAVLNLPQRRRRAVSSPTSLEALEVLECRVLLAAHPIEVVDAPQPAFISEDFETDFDGVIRFNIDAVIYANHFTQPGGSAPSAEVQYFTTATQTSMDLFIDQLREASGGLLEATYSLTFSTRVLTQQDYDAYDLGNRGQWLILKSNVIDSMKANDFGGAAADMAFVIWGPNATVGTANFYHGGDFISIASPTQGVVAHEFMHLLDDELNVAGEPGMVNADDLGDPSKYPLITTPETITPYGLNWEGVPLIRNILTYHDSGDGSTIDLTLLAGSLSENDQDFSMNGAAHLTRNELQLTNAEWQRGSIWFDQLLPASDFKASFDFQITQQGGIGWGDGFTFALIDAAIDGSHAIGDIGSGLGYLGLSGIAIEFDTYPGWGEPGYMHVGLDVGGSVDSVQIRELPFAIADAGWLTAEISIENGLLTVTLKQPDGAEAVVLATRVSAENRPQLSRVGFTAATASAFQRVLIDNVALSVIDSPAPPELLVGGPSATFTRRQSAIKVLPNATIESSESWSGGSLHMTMNLAGTRRKPFDQINLPSFAELGVSTGQQLHQNEWLFDIQFYDSTTDATIQAFLQGITFTTTRKGLKTALRHLRVSMTDSNGLTAELTQTIRVKKR